jgi:hypothetical protein
MALNSFKDPVTNTIPFIEAKFTSVFGDKFTVTNQNNINDLSDNIIAIHTTKTLESVVGAFTIVMVGQTNFSSLLSVKPKGSPTRTGGWGLFRPSGLIDIYINGEEVMLGMITAIQKSVDMTSGLPQRSWLISGTDLGKMFISTRIWYDLATNDDRPEQNAYFAGLREFTELVSKEKVANIIHKLFTDWYANIINKEISSKQIKPFKFSDGKGILDKLMVNPYPYGTLSTDLYSDLYYVQLSVFTRQTDILTYIQELACPPLNEVYFDTGGTKVQINKNQSYLSNKEKGYLIIRPTPYDDTSLDQVKYITKNDNIPDYPFIHTNLDPIISKLRMQDLPTTDIDDSLIQTKNLQITSDNMPSAYHIQPMNNFLASGNSEVIIPPEYDEIALHRYGYNVLSVPLNGYSFSDSQPEDLIQLCKKLQIKAKNWFQYNDSLFSGNITIKGDSKIRIGTVLNYNKYDGKIEDDYEEGHYYIAGVQQDWKYAQKYVTILSLERGVSKMFYR